MRRHGRVIPFLFLSHSLKLPRNGLFPSIKTKNPQQIPNVLESQSNMAFHLSEHTFTQGLFFFGNITYSSQDTNWHHIRGKRNLKMLKMSRHFLTNVLVKTNKMHCKYLVAKPSHFH